MGKKLEFVCGISHVCKHLHTTLEYLDGGC